MEGEARRTARLEFGREAGWPRSRELGQGRVYSNLPLKYASWLSTHFLAKKIRVQNLLVEHVVNRHLA